MASSTLRARHSCNSPDDFGKWSSPFEGWFADAPIRMDPKCLSFDRINHRTKRPWPTILLNWDSRTNVQNTESVLTRSQEKPGREKPEWRPAIRRHCLIRPNEGFFLKRFPHPEIWWYPRIHDLNIDMWYYNGYILYGGKQNLRMNGIIQFIFVHLLWN